MKTSFVLGIVTLFSTLFAAIADGKLVFGKKKYIVSNFALFMSFFILWFFIVFTNIGVDYNNYIDIVELVHEPSVLFTYSSVEPGLGLWSLLMWRIFPNPHWVLFTMKTFPLFVYYHYARKYKESLDLSYVVLAYCAVLYVQSFYLLAIQLSAAFVVWSYFCFLERKNARATLFLLIGISIHYSAAIMVIPFVSYIYATFGMKKQYHKSRVIFLACVYSVVIIFSTVLVEYAVSSFSILHKYAMYTGKVESIFSFYQFFLYVPAIFIIVILIKNHYICRVSVFAIMAILAGFVIGEMAMAYPILDRMYFHFSIIFIFFVPFYVQQIKLREISRTCISYGSTKAFLFAYYLLRLYIVYRDYLGPLNPAQMFEYRFFFPTSW